MAKKPLNSTSGRRDIAGSNENLPEIFRKIYYHLYTNSNASRPEVIVEDLSLLLLAKMASAHSNKFESIDIFVQGNASADVALIPLLANEFPQLLAPGQRFSLDDLSLRSALREMANLDLSHAPAHLIGEAFQALIGPRLRGEKGQFFTPKSLVRAMVAIIAPTPKELVLDPASGTGGFLAEVHLYQERTFPLAKTRALLTGIDKDTGLARLGGALLTLLSQNRSLVASFNSLDPSEWLSRTGSKIDEKYDVILTNPPFGSRIGVSDQTILRNYDFGHVWIHNKTTDTWVQTESLSGSEDPQVLFLELCVKALKPGGRMGIVLPEGMFGNKQTSYIWGWLKERGQILGLLDCPRTTFQPGTDTKTNVLFYRKNDFEQRSNSTTMKVSVALQCGHDRRGRSTRENGDTHLDDFPLIAEQFHEKNLVDALWRIVELPETDYYVPRYHYYNNDDLTHEGIATGAATMTLSDLIRKKIITIRKGHEVGSDAYGTGDIAFVRTSDLSNFEVNADPTKSVSQEIYEQYAEQQKLQAGDILMVVDGRYRIGTVAMLDGHNVKCVAQSHLRIISVIDRSKLDPYELLFALNIPSVKLRLRGLVFIQSTLGTLGSRLLELKIPILRGEGPWTERISQFKENLQHRARCLSNLKTMTGPEIEL